MAGAKFAESSHARGVMRLPVRDVRCEVLEDEIYILKPSYVERNRPAQERFEKFEANCLRIPVGSCGPVGILFDYFFSGHYRGTVVFSAAAIETILREKYPDEKSFYAMILKAKNDGLLDSGDAERIRSIRVMRNICAHQLDMESSEVEADEILHSTRKLIAKLRSP